MSNGAVADVPCPECAGLDDEGGHATTCSRDPRYVPPRDETLAYLHHLRLGVTVQLHADQDEAEVLVWDGGIVPIARANRPTLVAALAEVRRAIDSERTTHPH